MTAIIEESTDCQALADACRLLFGEDTAASPAFIRYLQMPGLKAAFRNLARSNHPDIAVQTGQDARLLQARFTAVRQAYELLVPYVTGEKEIPVWNSEPEGSFFAPPRPAPAANNSAYMRYTSSTVRASAPRTERPRTSGFRAKKAERQTRYQGEVPQRPLRFGEFLYYRREVTWEELFAALVWQRTHRPRLGEIALEKGILKADDMVAVRRHRRPKEMFGETAVRLALLHPARLRLLLGFQRLYDCPLGRYFTDCGILTPARIDELAHEQCRHNLVCRYRSGTSAPL